MRCITVPVQHIVPRGGNHSPVQSGSQAGWQQLDGPGQLIGERLRKIAVERIVEQAEVGWGEITWGGRQEAGAGGKNCDYHLRNKIVKGWKFREAMSGMGTAGLNAGLELASTMWYGGIRHMAARGAGKES